MITMASMPFLHRHRHRRIVTKCELSSNDKQKLHSRLAADIESFRKDESCRLKIEDIFDKRMDKLRIQAEYKKHQLDLLHERHLKVIELEVLLLSDFLYKDYYLTPDPTLVLPKFTLDDEDDINHQDDDIRYNSHHDDELNVWYPHPDRLETYDQDNHALHDIIQKYILFHTLFIVGIWLQIA
jgi:hypothetical protein